MQNAPEAIKSARRGGVWTRRLLKVCAFAAFTLVVLNPNVQRATLQVRRTLKPESLIQTNFPALPVINARVNRFITAHQGRHSEARLIAKFIVRNIHYVTDYENWGNLEYWPAAAEVWERGQEDCDGRAILATSLLRSRGFHSAQLVVGLDHMWIKVDENEKEPSKPPRFIALLNPNPNFSLPLEDQPRLNHFLRLAKAFLHPTAFCETSSHLFAEIPALRKAILIVALLLLCYHPCRQRRGLLVVLALGLAATFFLADWYPDRKHLPEGILGGALLLAAIARALVGEPRPRACASVFSRVADKDFDEKVRLPSDRSTPA